MNDKAEYVLEICEEMCHGPIPKHRTDKELLTFYAKRIKIAHLRTMANPLEDGINETLIGLDRLITAAKEGK